MRTGFFVGLAKDGIRKNKRLYLPYIMACITMITMYFIMISLQYQKSLRYMSGGTTLAGMMKLGAWVIAIFSVMFIFYTNTFLMKKRKKEFGLYHILGMGKRHICRILFWENLISAAISMTGGMILGLLLSKLAELGLLNIMRAEVNFEFYLIPQTFLMTLLIFGALFVLLYFNAVRQIAFTSTVSLLASEKTGEKPPKANWFLGLVGVVCLAVAYVICLKIKSPLAAITYFFLAVVLVIIGTYLVFVASSVVFCKLLQKNKKYYYRTNHFVSVSSMVYRMKRTGAGLASICVLATMVLVMVSSTASLYFGVDDVLERRYPRDVNISCHYQESDILNQDEVNEFADCIFDAARNAGANVDNEMAISYVPMYGLLTDQYVKVNVDSAEMMETSTDDIVGIYLFSIDTYNKYTGENVVLQDGEAIAYCTQITYQAQTIELEEAGEIRIVKKVNKVPVTLDTDIDVVPIISLYVNDIEKTLGNLVKVESVAMEGDPLITYSLSCGFDTGLSKEEQAAFAGRFSQELINSGVAHDIHNPAMVSTAAYDYDDFSVEYRVLERDGYFEMLGGLFYMGIILSIVFLFATALIIYYKQISEGFEDEARFEIMQKVGMTKKEIKQSINSQMLTVFFFPLLLAGVHICFAFPIIRKLLLMFMLNNVTLFAITCLLCFALFALIYMMIYKMTSNAYLKIVSGAENK